MALGLVLGIAAFEMSKTVNRGDTLENTVPFSAFEDKKVYAEAHPRHNRRLRFRRRPIR